MDIDTAMTGYDALPPGVRAARDGTGELFIALALFPSVIIYNIGAFNQTDPRDGGHSVWLAP